MGSSPGPPRAGIFRHEEKPGATHPKPEGRKEHEAHTLVWLTHLHSCASQPTLTEMDASTDSSRWRPTGLIKRRSTLQEEEEEEEDSQEWVGRKLLSQVGGGKKVGGSAHLGPSGFPQWVFTPFGKIRRKGTVGSISFFVIKLCDR